MGRYPIVQATVWGEFANALSRQTLSTCKYEIVEAPPGQGSAKPVHQKRAHVQCAGIQVFIDRGVDSDLSAATRGTMPNSQICMLLALPEAEFCHGRERQGDDARVTMASDIVA